MEIQTIPELILSKKNKIPNKKLFFYKEDNIWKGKTISEFYNEIEIISSNFIGKIKKGDKVGIISNTRYEWELIEKTLLFIGAIVVGINYFDEKSEINKIIQENNINTLIIENKEILKKIPRIKNIYSIEKTSKIKCIKDMKIKKIKNKRKIYPSDIAIITYTSGTSGKPKKIVYTHEQLISVSIIIANKFKDLNAKSTISWLPLCFMTGKILNLTNIILEIEIYFSTKSGNFMENIQEINPDYFLAVPRFYEKVYEGIQNKFFEKGNFFNFILNKIIYLNSKHKIFRKLLSPLTNKIKKEIFGKNLIFTLSGSAHLNNKIQKFFYGLEIPILEAYALSESALPISMNTFDNFKIGSVGKIMPGNQIKFSKDGEILVKNEFLSSELDKTLINREGFLKTGDLGFIDKNGFLNLIGRKKELIKTSTGLRISPIEIENRYRLSPLIEEIIVIGNNRKYLTALIVPTEKISKEKIENELKKYEKNISEKKRIKKFFILQNKFSIQGGEFSKNLKLRRDFIEDKYKKEIHSMY